MATKINKRELTIIKSVLAIVFGLIALFKPDITLITLVSLFGIFVILAGVVITVVSILNRTSEYNWNFWLIEGVVDIIVGIILLIYPKGVVSVFLIIVGLWAIIMGILQIVAARRFQEYLNKNLLYISAAVTFIIGLLFLFRPFEGGKVIIALLGITALIYGGFSIYKIVKEKQNLPESE